MSAALIISPAARQRSRGNASHMLELFCRSGILGMRRRAPLARAPFALAMSELLQQKMEKVRRWNRFLPPFRAIF
jgi:hypothetical protein